MHGVGGRRNDLITGKKGGGGERGGGVAEGETKASDIVRKFQHHHTVPPLSRYNIYGNSLFALDHSSP